MIIYAYCWNQACQKNKIKVQIAGKKDGDRIETHTHTHTQIELTLISHFVQIFIHVCGAVKVTYP